MSTEPTTTINEPYQEKWTNTFDFSFLIGWLCVVGIFVGITYAYQPSLIGEKSFFGFCFLKLAVMCAMGIGGGLLCRHYCKTTPHGYIVEGSHAWFKVNYTRKLQHFAAYLIPLLSPATAPHGILPHIWESLLVMLAFLLLIKPIRESFSISMLQFNALDRPEDRPHTLKWIMLGNIVPALVLGTIFQQIFEDLLHEPKMPLIIILIIGIGDGLAEPIGIHFGKKKYTVPSWNMGKRFVRSYAGSACVFVSSVVFVALFYSEFNSLPEFIATLILLPPTMTFAEAYAPHSMDTPVMMILGFGMLALISFFF